MFDLKGEVLERTAFLNELDVEEFWVFLTSLGVGEIPEVWDE